MFDMTYYTETGTYLSDVQYINMMDLRWRMIYPAPFFDPIAMQTLADPKILIMWGRFFYDWHPLVHAAVNKMVSYPITDFIYDTNDSKIRANYEAVFKKLNVRDIMIRAGLDYYVCGNAFLSLIMPFTRLFKCPNCGHTSTAKTVAFKSTATKLQITCPSCGKDVEPTITDINTQNIEDMHAILWNPMNMQLDYDEIIDSTDYYYSLPEQIKAGILKGERKYMEKYPSYFIKAAHKNKQIKFYSDKLLHIKRSTHSASYHKGFGEPITTAVLKQLFHLMLLMRAQDALAIDQILPWNILSPSANSGIDPAGETDLGNWKNQVRKEYEEWKKNPMRKSFFPFPINAQMIGAQGKALMLTPEMDAVGNQILAGMGVPQEFVYGGLQWSGANVSLRMLENQFINYRTMMQRLLDWIVESISTYFGYPAINIRMQDFKMADDVQQKNIVMNLAQSDIISKATMLKEVMPELNYEKEQETIKKEQLDKLKLNADIQRSQQASGLVDPQMMGPSNASTAVKQSNNPEQRPPRGPGAQI